MRRKEWGLDWNLFLAPGFVVSRCARTQNRSKRLASEFVLNLPQGLRARGWPSGAIPLVLIQELTGQSIFSLWASVSSTVKWVQ